jgi:putative PIN family toxin of toxin-antitoxin system
MRIVADTNVVVSGFLWFKQPGKLLDHATYGRIALYTSDALLAELRNVLAKPKLAKYLLRSGLPLDELMNRYKNITQWVDVLDTPRVVPNDPDDDHVVAAAIAADADFIVSGDQDLLTLERYRNIPIVTPAQAVQLIEPAQ